MGASVRGKWWGRGKVYAVGDVWGGEGGAGGRGDGYGDGVRAAAARDGAPRVGLAGETQSTHTHTHTHTQSDALKRLLGERGIATTAMLAE